MKVRSLLVGLLIAAVPIVSRAGEAAVRLKVRPMAASQPVLKYQLLPQVEEMMPGNAAQWYLRCFAEQRNFFFSKEGAAQRASYRTMPLAKLPVQRDYGGNALKQADWAARLDTVDWQVLVQNQTRSFLTAATGE